MEEDQVEQEAKAGRTDQESGLVHELLSGTISRREFMRRAALTGMSAAAVATALASGATAPDDRRPTSDPRDRRGKRAVEHHACPGAVPAAAPPLRADRRAHSFSWKW